MKVYIKNLTKFILFITIFAIIKVTSDYQLASFKTPVQLGTRLGIPTIINVFLIAIAGVLLFV